MPPPARIPGTFKTSARVDVDRMMALAAAAVQLDGRGWEAHDIAEVLAFPDRGDVLPVESVYQALSVAAFFNDVPGFLTYAMHEGTPWTALVESARHDRLWQTSPLNPSADPERAGTRITTYDVLWAYEAVRERDGHVSVDGMRLWFGKAPADSTKAGGREKHGQQALGIDFGSDPS